MTADDTALKCPHCQEDVYYTADMAGQVAECPACRGEIALPPKSSSERKRKVVLHRRPNGESASTKPQPKPELQELISIARDIRRIMLIVVITPGVIAVLSAVWYGTLRFIDLLQ